MEIYERLQERAALDHPIRVGLVGCGQMGSGLVHVIDRIAGMETAAIADLNVDRAVETLKSLGIPDSKVCVTNERGKAEDARQSGDFVVTEDAVMLAELDHLDAVVEATGITEVGSRVAWNCVMRGRHVIMLNVETDVTVGPLLHRLAKNHDCVYTAASGDEPGVCKMLYNLAGTMGFDVVCLGKGKNNPINFDATPEMCREEAERKGMNPKMLSAFKDGSKTMVELAAMSNATGLVPDVPGMHGPKVDVPDLNKVLVPETDGGILSGSGRVDFSTGKVAPGVFVIITTDDPRIRVDMDFLSMGDGPYYTLYRPYHLCNVETPVSIAEAVLYGESTIVSKTMVSEVAAIAKRDLQPGDVVGEIGSPDFFGRTYTYADAKAEQAIPLGLVPGGKVLQDISKGELLTERNFAPDDKKFVYMLRKMQDAHLAMEH
ncbi:MAG: NAD(P)H-dependent oxidoreductase [Chloroflexota bacterium]